MVEKINSKHQQIIKVLMRTFEFFKNDGPEVGEGGGRMDEWVGGWVEGWLDG